MTDVKENTTEIVQDKGKNKVETKSSTPKRKASPVSYTHLTLPTNREV